MGRGGFPSERGLACGLTLCSGLVRLQEEEKNKIQNDLRILTERLSRINESLARKVRARSARECRFMLRARRGLPARQCSYRRMLGFVPLPLPISSLDCLAE